MIARAVIAVAVVLAILRVTVIEHVTPSWQGTYQAIAHLFAGALLVLGWPIFSVDMRGRTPLNQVCWWSVWTISIVELVCFMAGV